MSGILRLSEAANLAVHACALLAAAGDERLSHDRMAEVLGVSESHLGKVLQKLVHEGLLKSARGAGGGFLLARKPSSITLLEIVECVNGPVAGGGCLLGRRVCSSGEFALAALGASAADLVVKSLGSITLQTFVTCQLDPECGKEGA